MRICLLSYRGNMYCGGQGVYVYYLAKHLAKLGHEVHLIQGPPYTWDIPGVTIHHLPNFNLFATRKFFTRFIPPGASLLELFQPINFYEFVATRFGFFPEMAAFSLRAFGIPEARIRVIYNGVDLETFRPDPGAKKIPRRLIFVGNTEDRKKGIRYLLEALLLLPPDVTLTVVDGGAPRHLLMEELRRKLNLGDRVQCTGKIPTAELVRKYHEAEIAVVPSLYEGFGFPAAEAMACALPVVSSDGGALPEVVGTDGKAGFLVPKRDPQALADAVRKLLDDPGLRQEIGAAGRKRVEENFSWDVAGAQMVALYQEAIARRRKA